MIKKQILDILKRENDVVSGETLCAAAGVSRVSIWKHIQKLKAHGYDIESSPKGYRLGRKTDALLPWEFPGREASIHCFEAVSSTMDIAREMARNGCPAFTTVIAERQEKGRGRLTRRWFSEKGGLYFTVVLRPRLPLASVFKMNFLASTVLAEILRNDLGVDARVKWPNDILIGEKKVCGMLSEMEAEGEMASFVNIGIGLNVNNDPPSTESKAVSIKMLLGRPIPRKSILQTFLDTLEKRIFDDDYHDIISEWKRKTITINRRVEVVTHRETASGLAVDIDDTGALMLRLDDGSLKRIVFGDCFLVGNP